MINNTGFYQSFYSLTPDVLDVLFVVNAIALCLLIQRLLILLGTFGRVINLSSAAQSNVNIEALTGRVKLHDGAAYAQRKLALIMWSRSLALTLVDLAATIVAVNPVSILGRKMVKQAYGVSGWSGNTYSGSTE